MKARAFIALLMALALKVNATLSYYQASDYMGENVFPLNSSTALAAYLNSIGIVGGGGNGISTNGGSGIGNTFTNAALAGQPMLPGWASLSNPTGALLGVGSDGTLRVSPNLGWSSLGLTGNIDTNSSDGIITNDPRALTLTNSANRFGGNGGSLTGIVFTIIYTNAGASGTNSAGTILTLNTNLTSGSSITNAIVTVIYTNAGGSFTNSSGTVLTLNTNAPGSGSVTSVTATSPLGATAGATPVISVASATGSGALVEQTGATLISPTLTNAMYLGPIAYNFTNTADDFWLNVDGSGGQSNIISGYYELRDTNNNLSGNFSINTTGSVTANHYGTFNGDATAGTNSQNGNLVGVATNSLMSYAQVVAYELATTVAANQFAGAPTNTPTAGYAAIWTGLINGNGSYSLSSVAFSPSLVGLGNVVNIAQVTNTETGLSLGGTWTGSLVGNASSATTASVSTNLIVGAIVTNLTSVSNLTWMVNGDTNSVLVTTTNSVYTVNGITVSTWYTNGTLVWAGAITNSGTVTFNGSAIFNGAVTFNSTVSGLTASEVGLGNVANVLQQPASAVLTNAATGGSAGQVFTSTGSGGAWSNAASGGGVKYLRFTFNVAANQTAANGINVISPVGYTVAPTGFSIGSMYPYVLVTGFAGTITNLQFQDNAYNVLATGTNLVAFFETNTPGTTTFVSAYSALTSTITGDGRGSISSGGLPYGANSGTSTLNIPYPTNLYILCFTNTGGSSVANQTIRGSFDVIPQ